MASMNKRACGLMVRCLNVMMPIERSMPAKATFKGLIGRCLAKTWVALKQCINHQRHQRGGAELAAAKAAFYFSRRRKLYFRRMRKPHLAPILE